MYYTQNPIKMKIPKTEAEYNVKSLKFLLLTITTMFLLISGLMIILGMSVYSKFHSFSFLYESAKSGHFFTPSVMVVLLGLIMFVVTLFGFFGSLKESTCLVNVYAVILAFVFVLELIVVCLSLTTKSINLMKHIDIPVESYTTDLEVQAELDLLQGTLSCCGRDSYLDYVGLEFPANHTTVVYSAQTEDGDLLTLVLPSSCCSVYGSSTCTKVRSTGCKTALVNMVIQNATVVGVLGVSVMFIQVLGIIFSLLLARCIRKLKSERELLKWKRCENMIKTRFEHEKQPIDSQSVYIEHALSSHA